MDQELELHQLLEQVHDRDSFFAFVRALVRDRMEAAEAERQNPTPYPGMCPDAGGWYNTTIDSYLEASLAWAEDTSKGVTQRFPETPSWKAFAVFLYVGKIYE